MLVTVLALSLLAGEQTVDQIVARAARTFGRQPRWLRPLARRYLTAFAGRTRPRRRDVIQFLLRDRSAARFSRLPVANWLPAPQRMQPVEAASHWDLPVLETIGDLAAWLECEPGELDWFADLKGLLSRRGASPRLRHYHYRVLQKRSGGQRLIEAPNAELYAWVVGDEAAPQNYDTAVLRQLIGFHARTAQGKVGEGPKNS